MAGGNGIDGLSLHRFEFLLLIEEKEDASVYSVKIASNKHFSDRDSIEFL
jgi:hypothetical protein